MNSNLSAKYSFIESNRVKPIFETRLGYDELLSAINSAKETIYFAGYCFRPGSLFNEFEKALKDAAKRGVVTYVLADHHGSNRTNIRAINRLKNAGVIWAYFRPLNLMYAPSYNFRLHKKLLIIDNTSGYTGGLGIDDSWIKRTSKYPEAWSDTHFRTDGPIVNEMQKSFISSWNTFCPKEYELSFNPEAKPLDRGVAIASIESPPSLETTQAGRLYIEMVNSAKKSVYATTAYFGPPKIFLSALINAAQRGVEVSLILNGKYNTHSYAAEAGRRWYKQLLEAGVKISEYQPTKMHSKLITVDERFSSIGSANFNFRSFYTDAEYNLLVDDPKLSEQLIAKFNNNLKDCREITIEDIKRVGAIRRAYRFGVSLARFLY